MLASTSRVVFKRVPNPSTTPLRVLQQRHAHALAQEYNVPMNRRQSYGQRSRPKQRPQSTPWAFKADTAFRPSGKNQTSRWNIRLGDALDTRGLPRVLELCKEMKQNDIVPDVQTYHHILRGCAKDRFHVEARAVIEDMELAGVRPDLQSYHYLLQAVSDLPMSHTEGVLDLISQKGLAPNEHTYELVIKRHCDGYNLEHALQTLVDLEERGMQATLGTYQAIIALACNRGHPRLALDLAEAFEASSFRRLENTDWIPILIACAEDLYGEGVERSWAKVVNELGVIPDEGTCIQVLHTAGRHGLPALGEAALQALKRLDVVWKEYHFAPLIEAFCRAKPQALQEAFATLTLVRESGLVPTIETARPIFDIVRADADALDNAWSVLDTLHGFGQTIDVVALNVLIQAAVGLSDLQRAVGVYKSATNISVSPDVETFNLLLAGCIGASHRSLGDQLLREMQQLGVTPDARTYERLVVLCLTQDNYEDAFFYLEEMKAQRHVPSPSVYDALIRKCVSVGDTRYEIAVEEMRESGYPILLELSNYIKSNIGGRTAKQEEARAELTLEQKRAMFEAGEVQSQ